MHIIRNKQAKKPDSKRLVMGKVLDPTKKKLYKPSRFSVTDTKKVVVAKDRIHF